MFIFYRTAYIYLRWALTVFMSYYDPHFSNFVFLWDKLYRLGSEKQVWPKSYRTIHRSFIDYKLDWVYRMILKISQTGIKRARKIVWCHHYIPIQTVALLIVWAHFMDISFWVQGSNAAAQEIIWNQLFWLLSSTGCRFDHTECWLNSQCD